MKKSLIALAAALFCGFVFADSPVSVSLKLSHPKENATKSSDSDGKNNGGWGSHTETEFKASIFEYEGKISCSGPKEGTADVKVEAYFITRGREKGSKDELGTRMDVQTFTFGGDNPKSYKFELKSPTIEQKTVKKISGGRNRRRIDKEETGERLMGVILRAVVDGKPVKVISEPSNMKWVNAGKKDSVEL